MCKHERFLQHQSHIVEVKIYVSFYYDLFDTGSSSTASKSEEVPIIVGSVAGTLLLVFMIAILIIGILLYKKTRPSYISKSCLYVCIAYIVT